MMYRSTSYASAGAPVVTTPMWATVYPEDNVDAYTGAAVRTASDALPPVWTMDNSTVFRAKSAITLRAAGVGTRVDGAFLINAMGVPPNAHLFDLDVTLIRPANATAVTLDVTAELPVMDERGVVTTERYTGTLEIPAMASLPVSRRVVWSTPPHFGHNGDDSAGVTADCQPLRLRLVAPQGYAGDIFIPCMRLNFYTLD